MASTGRKKIFVFLLFVLFKSGTSSTSSVNITAKVGRNVSLPCTLSSENVKVVQMQWHREVDGEQHGKPIVVYNPLFGMWEYSHSKGRLGATQNTTDQRKRFYLDLEDLVSEDNGVYVCSINTYPSGTITQYVKLLVEAEEDKHRPTELLTTEVPVSTSSSSTTAIKMIFSTALTTGGTTAHSDSSTSNNEPDASSVSISSTTSSAREPQTSTNSPLSRHSKATVTVAWTEDEQNTPYDRQNVSVVYTNATTVLQSATGTQGSKVNNISDEESTPREAGSGTQTTAAVTTVTSSDHQNHGTNAPDNDSRQHLPLIIILPILALLLCLGLVYRRYLIRKRMDGPPSFKPPPPPVKYTSMIEQQRQILMLDIPA